MTEAELKILRQLAEQATPGPWSIDTYSCYIWGPKMEMVADNHSNSIDLPDNTVARIRGVGAKLPIEANMKFIAAANPKTVLNLLNEIDRLQKSANISKSDK